MQGFQNEYASRYLMRNDLPAEIRSSILRSDGIMNYLRRVSSSEVLLAIAGMERRLDYQSDFALAEALSLSEHFTDRFLKKWQGDVTMSAAVLANPGASKRLVEESIPAIKLRMIERYLGRVSAEKSVTLMTDQETDVRRLARESAVHLGLLDRPDVGEEVLRTGDEDVREFYVRNAGSIDDVLREKILKTSLDKALLAFVTRPDVSAPELKRIAARSMSKEVETAARAALDLRRPSLSQK